MRNLVAFFAKYHHWFLFFVLEIASLVLLFRFNSYQGSVWFSSANIVVGKIYDITSQVSSFLEMGALNEQLTSRNLELEQQVKYLSDQLYDKQKNKNFYAKGQFRYLKSFQFIHAKVVSNTVSGKDYFITINKGSKHGVKKDMGVVCGNGIVGVVYLVGSNYSIIIPVLNQRSNISCSISGRNYFGYLHWAGGVPTIAYLDDVPRHAKFKIGDRIVTSGYSSIFPPGILVGKVSRVYNSDDGLSYRLEVSLSTDFGRIRDVSVINAPMIQEQKQVIDAAKDSLKHIDGGINQEES